MDRLSELSDEQIARVTHEANRALQHVQGAPGIPVAPPWDDFPADQQAGVISGVRLARSGATARELHDNWCAEKLADGWVYGEEKNNDAKTHPCLVAYDELPIEQRAKDYMFMAIVDALS